jgi:FAD/FMN-containing dehydrogenase
MRSIDRRAFVKLAGATSAGMVLDAASLLGISDRAVRDFKRGFHGTVLRPVDSGYDDARRIWNGRFDRRPALIARCADVRDVQRAVHFAHAEELRVAVRGGGHSFAGDSTCENGLVIDLSRMNTIRVDAPRAIVEAQAGAVGAELAAATKRSGLAVVLGGCSDVGIAGFTLGGGEGSLSSKYGLSCDNLVSADLVLADGRAMTASNEAHADLFWGLRGGGGNFGIVTSLRLRAHPLATIVAGHLLYEWGEAAAVIRRYRDAASSVPDELDVGLGVTWTKDGPMFAMNVEYAGDVTTAEPTLRSLRALGRPIDDAIAPISYHDLKSRPGPPAGFPSTIATGFVPYLRDDTIDAILALARVAPRFSDIQLTHLHGAVSRVAYSQTAFPLRQSGFDAFALAPWLRPEDRDPTRDWVRRFREIVMPHARGAYVNALDEDGDAEQAYGSMYTRLASLKQTYDPQNFFRMNRNVRPFDRAVRN